MKLRIREEEEDHSIIRGGEEKGGMGGAAHVVAASTRVIYGKLHDLVDFSVFNTPARAFGRCVGCGHALRLPLSI